MDKRIWKVEALIETNPGISFDELIDQTGYHKSTLEAILKNLKKERGLNG